MHGLSVRCARPRGACACRAREATSSSSALSRSCSWMIGVAVEDGAAADRIGFGASGYAGVSLAVAAPSGTGPARRGPGIAAAHAPAPTRDSLNLTIPSGGFTPPLCGLFFLRRSHQDQPLCVSNSLSGRHWELDQVPAVGDLTDIVQLGTGHHVSAGEGQRRVALQRRVAAHLCCRRPDARRHATVPQSWIQREN